MATRKERNNRKNYACCSVCGRPLFRAEVVGELETQCPKCKTELLINCTGGAVTIRELSMESGRES